MKIAFCFLVYDKIIRYDIWNKFFYNIDFNKYIVFIHPKKKYNENNYKFNYKICEKIIETKNKYDINIVKATLNLLKETFDYDNSITHYIFLTQSCIPLYSFNNLYKFIISVPKSIISFINYNKKDRYFQLKNELKKNITYNNFVKQQPNMILTKEDILLFLKYDFTIFFENMICPDEHYFINILNNIFKKEFIKKQINFCNYDLQKTQAIEFYNIDLKLLNKIRNLGFLFMRKVNFKSVIDIDSLLF